MSAIRWDVAGGMKTGQFGAVHGGGVRTAPLLLHLAGMAFAEFEVCARSLSAAWDPNPHIIDPLRPLIMKRQKTIITRGKTHQREKSRNSAPYISITSFPPL